MTDAVLPRVDQDAPTARPGRRFSWSWLGLVPFFAFAAAFLIIPTFYLVNGSFRTESGQPTLQNYADLSQPTIVEAFRASIEISVVTAVNRMPEAKFRIDWRVRKVLARGRMGGDGSTRRGSRTGRPDRGARGLRDVLHADSGIALVPHQLGGRRQYRLPGGPCHHRLLLPG